MARRYSMPLLSSLLVLMLAGCASGYKQFYQQSGLNPEMVAARRPSPPPATPIVERSRPGEGVFEAYEKRGYVVIGQSMFNSGRGESDDAAVRQAKDVGADLVLILNPRYTGSVTSSVPITTPTSSTSYSTGSATAYGPGGSVTAYGSGTTTTYGSTTNYVPVTIHRSDYGAVFFVKQRFSVGVFTRDLSDSERREIQSNKGVVVRLVVDGTPAFEADILSGDVITAVDGYSVSSVTGFSELIRDRQGRLVSLSIIRQGKRIEKSMQLNTRDR